MFGLFKKSKNSSSSSTGLGNKIKGLFKKDKLDSTLIEELEQLLYQADLGTEMVDTLIEAVQKKASSMTLKACLHTIRSELLSAIPSFTQNQNTKGPTTILIVGINGSGKTTSIAKLANFYKKKKQTVLLAAADTFRAAAVKQLSMWADQLSIPIVKGTEGGDPAACVYDGVKAALARNVDKLIIDTAGRLHTKTDLMGELKKIHQVCKKVDETAPHEVWIVIDASIGQNATEQIKLFSQYVPLTGIILTKWDGSAKGGACIAIQRALKLPIRFIGIGEGADDLIEFKAESFVEALLK